MYTAPIGIKIDYEKLAVGDRLFVRCTRAHNAMAAPDVDGYATVSFCNQDVILLETEGQTLIVDPRSGWIKNAAGDVYISKEGYELCCEVDSLLVRLDKWSPLNYLTEGQLRALSASLTTLLNLGVSEVPNGESK